ncbi:hypothetical protein AVEN_263485-1 [Araneus ventricosus]|uniref:Uncharacterized protein n=1 Tax=Araneus ventricosus TaxID=182803 RepID=A0A4Y2EUT8_ARAVE|nr:hypothetical protein AVEN_263485-1 [Araneus ventricosus]
MLTMVKDHVIKYYKKISPRPVLAPGSTLTTGRRDFIGHCDPRIIAPITSGSCDDPPFYQRTSRHRRWDVRVTPPLLYLPREREPAYLSGIFSSVYFAMPGSCD